MMPKYDYLSREVSRELEGSGIDLAVAVALGDAQDNGWEYVSGPAVTPSGGYVFLFRRPVKE